MLPEENWFLLLLNANVRSILTIKVPLILIQVVEEVKKYFTMIAQIIAKTKVSFDRIDSVTVMKCHFLKKRFESVTEMVKKLQTRISH